MTQHTSPRRPAAPCRALGSSLLAAAGVVGMMAMSRGLMAVPPALAAPLPYPQAVTNTEVAARAVLGRAGRESCLRGKLTRALLGLSSSCEASGNRDPLCVLADRAVVVTPMTLSFMDETSRQLLQLIQPATDGHQASAAVPAGNPRP